MAYIFLEKDGLCFLAASKVAIWKKPASGDKFGPYRNPMAHLDLVLFHSDFNYYGVVAWTMNKVINHPAVAGGVFPVSPYEPAATRFLGRSATTTHSLLTHNLGYVPKFFVAYDGRMAPHAMPVQSVGADRFRFVSAYATPTEIRLKETGFSSDAALPAVARSYQVLVFRDNAPDPALPLLRLKADDVVMGQGKFRSRWPHLRAIGDGDTPFAQATDRTAAVRNGAFRVRLANGGTYDFGNFTGSLPAPGFINVGIGV